MGGLFIFIACPGVSVAQSVIFKLIHNAFGFFQNKDYELPNGIIIFDSYSCNESGKRAKLSKKLVLTKLLAYFCYIALPGMIFVPIWSVHGNELLSYDGYDITGKTLLISLPVLWIFLFLLSIMEQLSDHYSHESANRLVNIFTGLNTTVITALFCVLLMAFPVYSTVRKQELVCFMQTNCQIWDCMDLKYSSRYSSLNITSGEYEGRQMQRVVINRTGKRFFIYITRNYAATETNKLFVF